MERNPEFYRPREKDQAFHPQPGYPDAQQWWFHDGVFDNGYCMELMFHLTHTRASIWFHVCDPDGNVIHVVLFFHPSVVVASTETHYVKIGDNCMQGKYPRYELHFRCGDAGADLVYECITQEFMEPPDGVFVGREQCPATPVYFALVFRPRCRVTGKLILGGKEIPVQGEGHGDHQWTNVGVEKLPSYYWYYGRIYLPGHTIVWWDTQLNQTFGYQRAKWLWVFKGEKLFEYLRNADLYVETSDLEIDLESGVPFPRKTVLILDERRIKGTATYTRQRIIENIPSGGFDYLTPSGPRTGWRRYIRCLSQCHSKFEIDGETIEADTMEMQEFGI